MTSAIVNDRGGFKAEIDMDTVRRMENGATSQERGQQRRIALLQLTKDSGSLIEFAKSEPDAFEEMANMVLDYHEHAKAILDVATSAMARIAFVHEQAQHG